jgi:hypothetical protein
VAFTRFKAREIAKRKSEQAADRKAE